MKSKIVSCLVFLLAANVFAQTHAPLATADQALSNSLILDSSGKYGLNLFTAILLGIPIPAINNSTACDCCQRGDCTADQILNLVLYKDDQGKYGISSFSTDSHLPDSTVDGSFLIGAGGTFVESTDMLYDDATNTLTTLALVVNSAAIDFPGSGRASIGYDGLRFESVDGVFTFEVEPPLADFEMRMNDNGDLNLPADLLVVGADANFGTTTSNSTIEGLRTTAGSGAIGLQLISNVTASVIPGWATGVNIHSTVDYTDSTDYLFSVTDPGGTAFRIAGDRMEYLGTNVQMSNATTIAAGTSAAYLGGRYNASGVASDNVGLASLMSYGGLTAVYEGDEADGDDLFFDWSTAFDAYDTAGADGDITISFPALTGTVAMVGVTNSGALTASTDVTAGDDLIATDDVRAVDGDFTGEITTVRGQAFAGKVIPLTAQFDTTTDTLADVTGWSYTLASGRWYKIAIHMHLTPSATGGSKWDLDGGTATMTTVLMTDGESESGSGSPTLNPTRRTTLAADQTSTIGPTATYAIISGLVLVDSGGTFEPRYAQEVDVADNSSLLAGSYMHIQDVTP